jgi:guanylate kinase
MRPGEQDGIDYHFVDVAAFERMVAEGAFLEHARVFDNYYGTAEASVRGQLGAGQDVVLEIDWQGARQVRRHFPDAVSIFVVPPTIEALRARLTGRGQDSDAVVDRRMRDARSEMSHYVEYDYLVVNDDFADALAALRAIVTAARQRLPVQAARHADEMRRMLGDPEQSP